MRISDWSSDVCSSDLGCALDEAVLELGGRNRYCASQFGERHRAREPPGGEVGKACIEDLAGAGEILEAAHDLLGRCHMIGPVRPIDVDTVGLEAPEAGFHRSNHRLSDRKSTRLNSSH